MRAADPKIVRQRIELQANRPRHWRELNVLGGMPCCFRAVELRRGMPGWTPCVCAYLETCPEHGITHVGTHD